MPTSAYIGLGSNLGRKQQNCLRALELLAAAGKVARVSSFYRTEPVGCRDQESFINAVAEFGTDLGPRELLSFCRGIEERLGRIRDMRRGPRTIDLDILLYGDRVLCEADLMIPHPRLAMRGFVLVPLVEIAPQLMHPALRKTMKHLLHELKDAHAVAKCEAGEGP